MINSHYNTYTNPSYYFSLAQSIHPHQQYTSTKLQFNTNPFNQSKANHFTFSKQLYPNKYNSSAHHPNRKYYKYRSTSLPAQCLITNPSANHFSYLEQLKKRDYIVPKHYRSILQLKKDYQILKQNSYDNLRQPILPSYQQPNHSHNYHSSTSIYSADLNRFSKYDSHKKLSKGNINNKCPIVKTNVKIYDKPDKHNKIASIKSNFLPQNNAYQRQRYKTSMDDQNQRYGQIPIMNCSIQAKSDNDGRYYSTVQSQFPAVLTDQRGYYDRQRNIFTTEATLVRDFPNNASLYNQQNSNKQIYNENINRLQDKTKFQHLDKNIQTQNLKNAKKYDTFVVRRKSSPLKSQQKYFSNQNNQYQYLQSMQKKKRKSISIEQIPQIKSPIKRKIIIEYQIEPPKKRKSPHKVKNKSSTKAPAQNGGLKYYYSKYYIAELQKKNKQGRSKSKSVRKNQKSQRKQCSKSKRSSSKYDNQHKTSKKLINIHSPKTKQKFTRPCQINYSSTHLLTTKK